MKKTPEILVELGIAKEVHLDNGDIIRWHGVGYGLYSNVSGNKLFILKKSKKKKKSLDLNDDRIKRGIALYDSFQNLCPKHGTLNADGKLENAVNIGRAQGILYKSYKWNENAKYIHEFRSFPLVWINRRTQACALTGGNIKITERGIEG
jgi:hypothetical protein